LEFTRTSVFKSQMRMFPREFRGDVTPKAAPVPSLNENACSLRAYGRKVFEALQLAMISSLGGGHELRSWGGKVLKWQFTQ
jgi:hypothetical protein